MTDTTSPRRAAPAPTLARRRLLASGLGAGALLAAGAVEASAHERTTRSRRRTTARRASSSTTATRTTTAASGTSSTGSVSGSTSGLTANAVAVRRAVLARFPQITTVGGVRADSLPDHPTGHALDFMIPSPTSSAGVALGTAIAAYLQANAGSLNVKYVIWRQHIWSVQRAGEGWRAMANRGSATANHMDHVHVTVN